MMESKKKKTKRGRSNDTLQEETKEAKKRNKIYAKERKEKIIYK